MQIPLFFLSCFLLYLFPTSSGTRRIRPPSEESASSRPRPPATTFLLSHPLYVDAILSFSIGLLVGFLIFILWRSLLLLWHFLLDRLFCLTRISAEDEEDHSVDAPTIFCPMLRRPESLLFIRQLQKDGLLPFPAEVIGRGGCGEVYKAALLIGSRALDVAIKKIDHPATVVGAANLCQEDSELLHFRMRQIRSEILTAGRMRHPNLLRLLAHVPNPDCHYLVYDYMPHGSLHDLLRQGFLEWPLRYKIALGIADGLEYLHMAHRPRVIHRDLKPANILIDRDLNARIADFGLAKLVQHERTASLMEGAAAAASNNVAGTVGYIAPEYYQTLTCTDKCDIYSFGVILAVLVTGRFPSDRFFEETDEMCIVGWVRQVLREEMEVAMAAIDRGLIGSGFEEQIMLMLKAACFCTYDDPNERPNSRDVRCMISQINRP